MPATENAPLRLPPALRQARGHTRATERVHALKALMRARGLSTVCEEARCPNLGECFSSGTATFMILGDRCTRRCHFCNVTTGKPRPVDVDEPEKLADAAAKMGLSHVVITSVDRDDLDDGGAHHFAACIRAVRARVPHAKIEVLTPDFRGEAAWIDVVVDAAPDVFNHNLETVPRLYRLVRPQSRWEHTTGLLRRVAMRGRSAVKSGIMVGLGERDEEVEETLAIMRDLGVHIATIGQYLRPTRAHWPVARYVDNDTYARFRAHGLSLGLREVFAGPFVRSSYHAGEVARSFASSSASSVAPVPSVAPSPRATLRILT